MLSATIQSLHIYPIKSMAGVSVDTLEFGPFGVKEDRCYMLVNVEGRFITQRSHPILSQFILRPVAHGWHVEFQGESIVIDDDEFDEKLIKTSVWKTPIQAREKSKMVSQWFSNQLNELVVLVEFDDLTRRVKQINEHEYPLAFADGYPLLVCNEGSLLDLNLTLNESLKMNRFRPNVVIDIAPRLEYDVLRLEAEPNRALQFVEPCIRCNVPAIDPVTSVFNKELHKRLKKNMSDTHAHPVFGMNAVPVGMLKLSVGDSLKVITEFD